MAETIYIDGTKLILGRLGTYVAKMLLDGKDVIILNSEKVAVTGEKRTVMNQYLDKYRSIGGKHKGPHWPKRPDDIVRRTIKGMLPKTARGKEAFKRVKTYIGIPKQFESAKPIQIEKAKLSKRETRYALVKDIAIYVGGKTW